MSDRHPDLPPHLRIRARGAGSNASGRFEAERREAFDDGWDLPEEERALKTQVTFEVPRSALSYNSSPDIPFDRSINPYRGCEHGCIYCYARPSHAYLGFSPGLDFETRLIARPGIAKVLERELRAKSYRVAPIALGTNTDPYQPIDAKHQLMREILTVLRDFRHPVGITTKGTLIERDIDILSDLAAQGLVGVGISLTTLDPQISRSMEPRAAAPARRLQVIRQLAKAGIPVRAMIAPVVPGLTDHELEPIMAAAREAGARYASVIPLRLPLEVAPLFKDWLEAHHPNRAQHVMNRVHEMQGGKDYDNRFGLRFKGQGLWAELLNQRLRKARKRLGYDEGRTELRLDLFKPPPRAGDQLDLFAPA